MGGAVGDALGAPVEFMSRTEILDTFGSDGITRYVPAYGVLGAITDDTQMTLFTAEGLLEARSGAHDRGFITEAERCISMAYLDWLTTQGESPQHFRPHLHPGSFLLRQAQLHNRRAPGGTCLSALRDLTALGEPASNDSKGCGGVMRVAPIGLVPWLDDDETFALGTSAAGLTHGHPTGKLTGGVLATLIRTAIQGGTIPEGLDKARHYLKAAPGHHETLRAIEQAQALAASNLSPSEAIARMGEGWVAEEALAISIYCALVARDFREGIVLAVNHDGDSDSTGAITGNILGALWGLESIPTEWLEPLELHDAIRHVADDLYKSGNWSG
ncbi:MAG: ADP-ribosylglycohydrolase family protein [Lautropia sp.]|nr:ADP-ribosylglycohydrolase family protein [Lautropia sp.]